jgi:hypothetical protein
VFENRVLRRIFGPKRDEVKEEWGKMHNGNKFRDVYFSQSKIKLIMSRRMRQEKHVARMGEKRNAYKLWSGESKGKSPLRRPRCKSLGKIKIDLGGKEWCGVEWTCFTQDKNK